MCWTSATLAYTQRPQEAIEVLLVLPYSKKCFACNARAQVTFIPKTESRIKLLHTLRDRSRCPDARATPSKRKTSFFCPIARIVTPTPITPSAFFYIRCILVHVTFSTPTWYTEYLFGTFLAHYNDFWSFSVRLG